MRCLSASDKKSSRSGSYSVRGNRGAVMPWFILSFGIIFAFLAFTADVMRTVHAVSVLQFGSQAAALAAYRNEFLDDGTARQGTIEQNVMQYSGSAWDTSLQTAGGNNGLAWNLAPVGPKNGKTQTAVNFTDADVAVVRNPNQGDAGDFFLQVSARRNGDNSLTMFFLPTIYAANTLTGQAVPANANVANPYRTTEVITQPATRIGAGAAIGTNSKFAGYATFPIAISNVAFSNAATLKKTTYTLDIVSSNFTGTKNDLKGAFVNLTASGGNQYYGTGQGTPAVNQLLGTLSYFQPGNVQTSLPPAAVERGSALSAFDPTNNIFQQNKTAIINRINALVTSNPARYYIFPVISTDPLVNQANKVVGFARAQIVTGPAANSTNISMTIQLGDSNPMTNASIGTSVASIPAVTGAILPTPGVAPFNARTFDPAANTIAPRPFGVVMAPTLSPRLIPGGLL